MDTLAIEPTYRVVLGDVNRFRMTAGTGTTIDPEDRVAFRAEWRDLVDIFGHLVAAYDAGRLPPDLQSDLIDLSARLADLAPTLERLRLRQPDPATRANQK